MNCPIYRQAYSLIQQGVLSIDDLILSPLMMRKTEILAMVLHPEDADFKAKFKAMGNLPSQPPSMSG